MPGELQEMMTHRTAIDTTGEVILMKLSCFLA